MSFSTIVRRFFVLIEVWISVCGIIYDVSSSRQVYGKDGQWCEFAGRDISVSFSKYEFDGDLSQEFIDTKPELTSPQVCIF